MIPDIPDWETAINLAKEELYPNHPGLQMKSYQEAAAVIGKALELLLISKGQKYGKNNILCSADFGIDPRQGVALRMNDKFERLKNGLKGVDLGKEGFSDTWGDLMGYSAIGMLIELGWYKLPIVKEEKK